MTNDEMKRAVDLLAEYARTGLFCVGDEEADLLRRFARTGLFCVKREEAELLRGFARTMEEWGK